MQPKEGHGGALEGLPQIQRDNKQLSLPASGEEDNVSFRCVGVLSDLTRNCVH